MKRKPTWIMDLNLLKIKLGPGQLQDLLYTPASASTPRLPVHFSSLTCGGDLTLKIGTGIYREIFKFLLIRNLDIGLLVHYGDALAAG